MVQNQTEAFQNLQPDRKIFKTLEMTARKVRVVEKFDSDLCVSSITARRNFETK